MGPGILIRYSKQVLGVAAVLLVVGAAILCFFQFRGPVGGASPYEVVNQLEDCTLTTEQERYPADVKEIHLLCRNDAAEGELTLPEGAAYVLEVKEDGTWHTLRSETKEPHWIGEGGVVAGGSEVTLTCQMSDYQSPLESGSYRIVLPDCSAAGSAGNLAAEFEVS